MEIVALPQESVRGSAKVAGTLRLPSEARPDLANGTLSVPATERTWRDELRLAIRDPAQLVAALELPAELIEPARKAARSFPLFAPWPYVRRMAKSDPTDPLLRQ